MKRVAIISVILGVLFGGGFYLSQKGYPKIPESVTTDWQTIDSDNFKIDIPTDFKPGFNHPSSGTVYHSDLRGSIQIYEWTPNSERDIDYAMKGKIIRNFIADGRNGKLINLSSDHFDLPSLGAKSAFITNGLNTIEILFGPADIGQVDDIVYNDTLINQILSTLKFTESQTSTNDWKTYKNEELGFEFKHPKGMTVTYEIIENRVSESPDDDCGLPYTKVSIGYNFVIQNDVCKIPSFKKLESENDLKDSLIKIKSSTYTGELGEDTWRLFYYYFNVNNTNWRGQILGEPFNTFEEILKTIKPI